MLRLFAGLPALCFAMAFPGCAFAQIDSLPAGTPQMEEFLEALRPEEGTEDLDAFLSSALSMDLNRVGEGELRQSGLLTEQQIAQFLRYREAAGKLLSLYELQAIPGFDSLSIQRIRPYFRLGGELDDFHGSALDLWRQAGKELQYRSSRFAEPQLGYRMPTPEKGYQGSPWQMYFRYRAVYARRFSLGLVVEKDRGEPFWGARPSRGPDFMGIHAFFERPTPWIQALALGDYRVGFGQGLLAYHGFGFGKSALAVQVKRSTTILRPSTSGAESGFRRGIASTLNLAPNLQLTLFAFRQKQDGTTAIRDSAGAIIGFTALGESGLHRTLTEIAGQKALVRQGGGLSLQYARRGVHIGLNSLYEHLSLSLSPAQRVYNRSYFRGNTLHNLSVDYAFRVRNIQFFGEGALSRNGALAGIAGLQVSMDKKVDYALLFRGFSPWYQALEAAPFADGSGGRNERGVYSGWEVRPFPRWVFRAYADFWRHPDLRYTADGPSRGQEYRLRADYEVRRKWLLYVEWRSRRLEQNDRSGSAPLLPLSPERFMSCRFHTSRRVTPALELRGRLDVGWAKPAGEAGQGGWAILQDVLYRPIQSPLSLTARVAYYHTDGYDVRFYEYENDLLNTFSIAPYYNKGWRSYLNLRVRPLRGLTLEARIARSRWRSPDKIGSGLDAFPGPVKTQVSAQIKYTF
jgi:hypothetical protein